MKTIRISIFCIVFMVPLLATAQRRLDVEGDARIRGSLDLEHPASGSLYIGEDAGMNDNGTETQRNVFIGSQAGASNNSGESNVFIGIGCGELNTDGGGNVFMGYATGLQNTEGSSNTFIGTTSGFANTTASRNTFIGSSAGQANTTGENNTNLGFLAGFENRAGNENTMLGSNAGRRNTSSSNTFVGFEAGLNSITGSGNTIVGREAGENYSDGFFNTFMGDRAGREASGNDNAFFGAAAGLSTTGNGNTLLGRNAGISNRSGNNNTIIGFNANVVDTNLFNASAIGAFARVDCNNCLALGSTGINAVNVGIGTTNPRGALHILKESDPPSGLSAGQNGLLMGTTGEATYKWIQSYNGALVLNFWGNNVGIGGLSNPAFQLQLSANSAAKPVSSLWTVPSDANLNANVTDFEDGLEVLQKIRPVWFEYNGKADLPVGEKGVGVVAQEIAEIAPYMVKPFIHRDTFGNSAEYLGYDANALFYILVNSVQEQQDIIEETQSENDQLRKELATLRSELDDIKALLQGRASGTTPSPKPSNPNPAPGATLGQNIPNPFGESTVIPYHIPETVQQAVLQVTAQNGSVVRSIRLEERGSGQLTLSLPASGTYFYSLVLDGKIADTKTMVASE